MRNIKKLLGEHDPDSENKTLVVCPVCKFECVHTRKISRDETIGRQGSYVIHMYCENEHTWEVVITDHKGSCFISIENEMQVRRI